MSAERARQWREWSERHGGDASVWHVCPGESCPSWADWCSKVEQVTISATRITIENVREIFGDPVSTEGAVWNNERKPGVIAESDDDLG